MHILFSLTYYTPYSSGLTLYVKRLAQELQKKENNITVLCMRHLSSLQASETINNISVKRAAPLFQISKGFFSLDWIFQSYTEVKKAEAVIINLPQFEGVIPALFGKLLGKKVISIYHCEVVLPAGFLNRAIQSLLNISNKVSLFLSETIITYTKDFGENSRVLKSFLYKTKYIYPPIPVPKIDKRVQDMIRKKITSTNRQVLIGVAARLAAEKGIEYLLEGIPLLRDKLKTKFKILIAGSLNPVGEESYKRKILELAKRYKDDVVFLGELKEEEMGSFYSLLDILVLPSVNSTESFGMVQVEAMMMGVPVVVSDLPGVRVPVQKTGMGQIVPVKDIQMLASAIREILLNRKTYIKDNQLIKNTFSVRETTNFYLNLL